jgi:hypothetical protein
MGMRAWVDTAKACGRWIVEPRLFWTALGVVAVAISWSIRPGATEGEVRFVAMVLQLLGVAEVAKGIGDTRKLFGKPGIVEWTTAWWDRRPWCPKRIVVGSGAVTLGGLRANARGSVMRYSEPGAPIEERVAALEHNLGQISGRLDAAEQRFDRTAQEHGERLESEARLRAEGDAANRKLVEVTETGGLALSTAGAVVLVVGIVLGSFPDEFAGLLGRCG